MDPFEERSKNFVEDIKYQDPFERKKMETELENDPFLQRSIEANPTSYPKPVQEIAKKVQERGMLASFARGSKSGVSGLLLGADEQETPKDETFGEHLASLGGELISDLPAMIAGGEAGATLGALGGAALGPIGATGGALLGAGAGAFSLPSVIKKSFAEYRDYAKKGGNLTFGEFLERAGRVAKEGGKSALVGAATAQASKLLPAIAKIPGAEKILNTRLGKGAVEGGLELGALTGAHAATELELPNMQQMTDNLAAIVGFKAARSLSSLGKKAATKFADKTPQEKASLFSDTRETKKPEIEQPEIVSTEKAEDVKPLDIEKTPQEKLAEFENIKENRPLTKKEQAQYDSLVPKKEELKSESPSVKEASISNTPKAEERSWFNIVSNLLPDSVRQKGRELGNKIAEHVPEPIKEVGRGISKLKKTARQKMYFDMVKDHIGERNAKIVESQFKWREALENAEKEGKFTKEQLEEMNYYRQRTGNPFKKSDTAKALEERLPENAKKFVDNVVDTHLRDMLKEWNDNPNTKNITPREGLEDFYLPGLYEYDPKKFAHAYDEVSRQFKTKNPFSNEKVFLNYLEAFQKAGLKPRYKNIVELMGAYDKIMLKTMANSDLVKKIHNLEDTLQEKLIVRATDEEAYNRAKSMGFVPFDDVFLRRYVAGEKDGKPIWATTAAPALVHPDFGAAFQGVFRKDAYKPESPFWKAYDSLADTIRFSRVSLSPFHYGAIMEHAVGALGPKALAVKKWTKQAHELRNDKEFMQDAARYVELKEPVDKNAYEKGQSLMDKAIELLPEKPGNIDIKKGLETLRKGLNYLHEDFIPNIKLITWKDFTEKEIAKLTKDGKPPSPEQVKRIKRDMGELVNDLYGGQQWQTQRFFNNPKTLKWLRRAIAYPNWSVSSLRQAQNAFLPGIKGNVARIFWVKYILGYLATQGALKFMNSGWEQTDKENKSIKGVKWNLKKAKEGLLDGDPTKWYMFPLPDFDVKIAGNIFNPGRDAENKKLYAHFGKQALEILHYIEHPFDELFAKSNPLLQMSYKQIMGHTPYEESMFAVRGKYKNGKREPWDATKPHTLGRVVSRGKELISDVAPFAAKTFYEKGAAPYVASGLGTVPISKGMSLFKAQSYIEDAIRNNDVKSLNKITKILRENSYSEAQIKRTITKVRNQIKKEKET